MLKNIYLPVVDELVPLPAVELLELDDPAVSVVTVEPDVVLIEPINDKVIRKHAAS